MPMPLNGKFLEKYGRNWKDMDDGEKQMAVMSEIFDLREDIAPVKEMCKTVEKHKTYFKWIAFAIGVVATALLTSIVTRLI